MSKSQSQSKTISTKEIENENKVLLLKEAKQSKASEYASKNSFSDSSRKKLLNLVIDEAYKKYTTKKLDNGKIALQTKDGTWIKFDSEEKAKEILLEKNKNSIIKEYRRYEEIMKKNNKIASLQAKNASNKIEQKNILIKRSELEKNYESINERRMKNLVRLSKINETQTKVLLKIKESSNAAKIQNDALKRSIDSSIRDINSLEERHRRNINFVQVSISEFDKNIASANQTYLRTQQSNLKALQDRLSAEKALAIAISSKKALENLGDITRAINTGMTHAYNGLTNAFNANTSAITAGLTGLGDTVKDGFNKINDSLKTMGDNIAGLGNVMNNTNKMLLEQQEQIQKSQIDAAMLNLDFANDKLKETEKAIEYARLKALRDLEGLKKGIPPPEIVDFLNKIRCPMNYAWVWRDDEKQWRCIIGTENITDYTIVKQIGQDLIKNNNNTIYINGEEYRWGGHTESAYGMNRRFHTEGLPQIDYKIFAGLDDSNYYP
jgi:hypothetical protein